MEVTVVIATYGGQEWANLAIVGAALSVPGDFPVVFEHQPGGTLASARNAGAERVETRWLCFLDADDRLGPSYLKVMMSAARQQWDAPPLLAPAVSYVEPGGGKTRPAVPNAGRWPKMNECVIGTVLEHDLFNEAGGFKEWTSLEDYELWLRCVSIGAQIVHVPSAVYLAGRDGAALGRGRNRDQSPYHRIVRQYRDLVPGLR